MNHLRLPSSMKRLLLPSCIGGRRSVSNSVTELGQSSGRSPAKPDAYCTICMEEKHPSSMASIKGCTHSFCTCCVAKYVVAKVEANQVSIRCPVPGCESGSLEPEMCRPILPPEVYKWWGRRLHESAIPEKMKLYCPHKRCSELLVIEEQAAITAAICPHCSRMICARCRVPWHAGLSCKAYQKLANDEKDRVSLMNLAKAKRWQTCPRCKFLVEKIDGCNYINCRCGKVFCYKCGDPVKRSHQCSTENRGHLP